MTNTCRHCGSSFPDGANFCLVCGNPRIELPPAVPAEPVTPETIAQRDEQRSASLLQELAVLAWQADPVWSTQIIDPDEYRALVQRVRDLRKQVVRLARPTDFAPRHFFALFDRVRCNPWYAPDFLFIPISHVSPNMQLPPVFGPGLGRKWPKANDIAEEMDGFVYLYTRLAILPRWYPRVLKTTQSLGAYWYAQQLGLRGLSMERSAQGFLQFAVLCQEASLWQSETSGWRYAADWEWVASPQHLEELIAELNTPMPVFLRSVLKEPERRALRQIDPRLRVRMQGEQAQVGGLAYSYWDGFAWLECELRAPNEFRISRLKELHIGDTSRNLPWY